MGSLSNLYISQSYQSLAHLGTNTSLVPGTMTELQDGIGQSLNIYFDGTNISSSGNIYAANITGSGGGTDLTSLNQFTASQNTKNSTLASVTASLQQQLTNIGSQSGSWITETETGSFLITASFNNGNRNLTFTKGDNTTFAVNIPDVSGSTINTGSFATTGSNTFYGNQVISGSSSITYGLDVTNGIKADYFYTDGQGIFTPTLYGANVGLGKLQIEALDGVNINGHLTASLQQGYVWVGDSLNKTKLVATSSFFVSGSGSTDISALNAFTSSQETKNATLSNVTQSLQSYTASNDTKWSNLAGQSGSWITESETGSFARYDVSNPWSADQTFTNISAVSASFTYVKTTYETSSIIYSSGSNQFGDAADDIQTLYGSVRVMNQLTASGLNYPTADNGAESFIQTDGAGNLSLQYVKTIYQNIRNRESTTIQKGTPLFVSGSTGDNADVFIADAGNPLRMPATLIAGDNTLAAGATGKGIIFGHIEGVNTTGYPAGTEVYVGVGGGWTSTRPTGSATPVQPLGVVTREGSNGMGIVLTQVPFDLPNLQTGYLWVGNGNNQPITLATSSFIPSTQSGSFATTGSNTFIGDEQVVGVVQASDSNVGPQWASPTVFQGVGTSAVAYDQFVNAGNYDALHIESQLNNGTIFQDYNGSSLNTWMQIPANTGSNPAPQFKRGLNITGSLFVSASNATALILTGSILQAPNYFISSSRLDVQSAIQMGDGSYFRFLSGSSYYNFQLNPSDGAFAFSRSGVSNTKTLQLAGYAGANTTFENNPVVFTDTTTQVTFNTPVTFNNGINNNVQITGSLRVSGSSILIGNQTITGSTFITGSQTITGSILVNGSQEVVGTIQASDANVGPQYYAPTVFQGVGTSAVAYDQFVNGGNYDAVHIETNASAGTVFQDYNGTGLNTWLSIPTNTGSNPKPIMSRGLEITGSLVVTGSARGNVQALTISSNTASMDLSKSNYFTLTLANSTTTHITATNIQPGTSATLVITTGTNSSASLAPILLEPSGSDYVATNGSSKKDVLSFVAVDSTNLFVVSTKNML